jgi:hypothetical protein
MGQSEKKCAFPEGTENTARTFVEGLCERSLRKWRSVLNIEYVQKGKHVRAVYGSILLAVWVEFVEEKKTAKRSSSECPTKGEGYERC